MALRYAARRFLPLATIAVGVAWRGGYVKYDMFGTDVPTRTAGIMSHEVSAEDRVFQTEFETCQFPPAQFNHRAHIRLAYIYLTEHDTDSARDLMQRALLTFIRFHGIDPCSTPRSC